MGNEDIQRTLGEHEEMLAGHGQRLSRIESCLDSDSGGGGIAQMMIQVLADMNKTSKTSNVQLAGIVLTFLVSMAALVAPLIK